MKHDLPFAQSKENAAITYSHLRTYGMRGWQWTVNGVHTTMYDRTDEMGNGWFTRDDPARDTNVRQLMSRESFRLPFHKTQAKRALCTILNLRKIL